MAGYRQQNARITGHSHAHKVGKIRCYFADNHLL